MNNRKDSNKFGIIAENNFINGCILRNISIFKNQNPIGEMDFIIYINNKLLKIQVKSTFTEIKNNIFNISIKRNRNKLYTDLDFIACYIHKSNDWYIIPFDIVKNQQAISICLSNNKYIQYINKWDFDTLAINPTINKNIDKINLAINYFKNGSSKQEIARILEVHYSVINRWLREAGYGIRDIKIKKEELISSYNNGITMKDLAIKFNTTVWTIRKYFREYNILPKSNNCKSNKIKELCFESQNGN